MRIYLIALIVCSFTLNACVNKGCTDPESIDYNADADKDDESCNYEGKVVFWYDSSTSGLMTNYGITSLTYYIGGIDMGTFDHSIYWDSAPDCDEENTISVALKIPKDEIKTYVYSAIDQNGVEQFTGSVSVSLNSCTNQKIEF
jgi:hypothetical protein